MNLPILLAVSLALGAAVPIQAQVAPSPAPAPSAPAKRAQPSPEPATRAPAGGSQPPAKPPAPAATPITPATPATNAPGVEPERTEPPAPPERGPGVINSSLDRDLFFQLLVGEVQTRQGDPLTGYQLYLDAAKRHRSAQLFQRAVEIALQARDGERALAAAQAWRLNLLHDREAAEYTAQILMALGRNDELSDPLRSIIRLAPADQRAQVVASLPRSLARIADRKVLANLIDETTQPWREPPPGMAEAWAASSEGWMLAGEPEKAVAALKRAHQANPKLLTVGLLALDLMTHVPELESIALAQLKDDNPPLVLRLAYARKLAGARRLPEAAQQLDQIVAAQPDNAGAWLTLAAVRLELKQDELAEKATLRFLELQTAQQLPPGLSVDPTPNALDPEQGYLLLAQISQGRKQYARADEWLRKADPEGKRLKVQLARARMMALDGKLEQARTLIRALPEAEPRDAMAKVSAEVQLLREAQRYDDAYKVLEQATQRYPEDPDFLYDQAMLAERLKRHEDAERLLRRVIAAQPDHSHAYNALGYSLVERGVRLDEARQLITKALELKPGDPYITDSLGWLEFRAGRLQDAVKWLRQAYVAKPDTEIAAHLGEALWQLGQRDEALRVWREGQAQDNDNETLQETLKRLQVPL